MGIPQLFTLIKNKKAYEMVDIVNVARNGDGIEILVDFDATVRFLTQLIITKVSKEYDNTYLTFPIGEFDIYEDAIASFHHSFKACGIRLVWFIDGPRGVDEMATEQKEETYSNRIKKKKETFNTILNACNYGLPLDKLEDIGPFMFPQVAAEALKRAGAEVIQILQGEADDYIAFEFHRRKAYAILTNDTDFAVFPDCKFIMDRLMVVNYEKSNLPFVVDDDIPGQIFCTPKELIIPVISQRSVLKMLNFSKQSEMVVLSIIKGNDNTRQFALELQFHLQLTRFRDREAKIDVITSFISKEELDSDNFTSHPSIRAFISSHKGLKDSIKFCQDFYSLRRVESNLKELLTVFDPRLSAKPTEYFLSERLSKLEIWKELFSIYYGSCYDIVVLQRNSSQCPSINSLMRNVRKFIFPYISRGSTIYEWMDKEEFSFDTSLVKVDQIHGKHSGTCPDEDKCGLKIFEKAFSLDEPAAVPFFQQFNFEVGVLCHSLRCFYKMTLNNSLNVSLEEFKSLCACVFYHYSKSIGKEIDGDIPREVFLGLQICPTENCATIVSWFLYIYLTAKYLVGGATNLCSDIPTYSHIISGSVFYGFYENKMCAKNKRAENIDDQILNLLTDLELTVLEMYKEEFNSIISV